MPTEADCDGNPLNRGTKKAHHLSSTGMHDLFKFSVTCHTENLAIVYCLRALAEYSQKEINPRIAWGGTKDADWERDQHCVTFHFTSKEIRNLFVETALRLFPKSSWDEVRRRDDDPAKPQLT